MGSDAARNLVLTGFMCTGKTTVGRILAERLGCDFVGTDEVIESRAGPIPQIFERDGEEVFRAMERSLARELADRSRRGSRLVIATGGRMMLDPQCAAALEPGADVVCLLADVDTVVARATRAGAAARPLLAGPDLTERVRELLAQRREGYGRFASVDTEGLSPAQVADAVLECTSGPR